MKSQRGWCRKQGCCCESSRILVFSVKSHSLPVEEADANRITSSLREQLRLKALWASKATPTPKEEKAPKVDKAAKLLRNQLQQRNKGWSQRSPLRLRKKPQSRNFKAEREARAKAEAERRQTAEAVTTVIVTVINKGNDHSKRQNNICRKPKRKWSRQIVIWGTAVTIVIVTVIWQTAQWSRSYRNNAQRCCPQQSGRSTYYFKARAAAWKQSKNAESDHRQWNTLPRRKSCSEQMPCAKEQENARKEQQAEVAAQKRCWSRQPCQHRLLNQPSCASTRYTS